ncbi:31312_t:CDS:10 [Racocetra persica]|uniref:31312_t:CDS:1 n=1 Tax=Racocetra persica TaxID=160502 RepID=A0ACA9KCX5_9GLOM|nr:31312_t:CDS:10 [Racocetra persica]
MKDLCGEKAATPVGWIYYEGEDKQGYSLNDKASLRLTEALWAVKDRGRALPIDGIYSIIGLLPYSDKVKVDYEKDPESVLRELEAAEVVESYDLKKGKLSFNPNEGIKIQASEYVISKKSSGLYEVEMREAMEEELCLGNDLEERLTNRIYNRFTGSLGVLKNLKDLEKLQIEGTYIDDNQLTEIPKNLQTIKELSDAINISRQLKEGESEDKLITNFQDLEKELKKFSEDSKDKEGKTELSKLQSPEQFGKFNYLTGVEYASTATTVIGGALTLLDFSTTGGVITLTAPLIGTGASQLKSNLYDAKQIGELGEVNQALKDLKNKVNQFLEEYDDDGNEEIDVEELINERKKFAEELNKVEAIVQDMQELEEKVLSYRQGSAGRKKLEEEKRIKSEIEKLSKELVGEQKSSEFKNKIKEKLPKKEIREIIPLISLGEKQQFLVISQNRKNLLAFFNSNEKQYSLDLVEYKEATKEAKMKKSKDFPQWFVSEEEAKNKVREIELDRKAIKILKELRKSKEKEGTSDKMEEENLIDKIKAKLREEGKLENNKTILSHSTSPRTSYQKNNHKEEKEKVTSDFRLYTITKEMLGFYSIAEVVEDSNKRPEKTIFCYLEEGFGKHQVKSLQATARLVKANGSQVFTSLEEVAEYLNSEQVAQVEVSRNQRKYDTKEKREQVTELDISNKNLEGELDLSDFINLEVLICNSNNLTSLNVSKQTKLESLTISKNSFPSQNPTWLSHLANLKELYLRQNNFSGSLEFIQNMTNLEVLDIVEKAASNDSENSLEIIAATPEYLKSELNKEIFPADYNLTDLNYSNFTFRDPRPFGTDWENKSELTVLKSDGQSYQVKLTKLGRKAVQKATQTLGDSQEKGQEVKKQKIYYNNSIVTLIAVNAKIDAKVDKENKFQFAKHIIEKIVNSSWFTRSWTFQEGLLSKQTIFMFDDGYDAQREKNINLGLSQALDAIKHRKQTVALDGIYSILGLLPYGYKIKVKYKEMDYKYTEEELEEALLDMMKENKHLPIKITYSDNPITTFQDESKIFIDMVNKKLIEGEKAIQKYKAQIEIPPKTGQN